MEERSYRGYVVRLVSDGRHREWTYLLHATAANLAPVPGTFGPFPDREQAYRDAVQRIDLITTPPAMYAV